MWQLWKSESPSVFPGVCHYSFYYSLLIQWLSWTDVIKSALCSHWSLSLVSLVVSEWLDRVLKSLQLISLPSFAQHLYVGGVPLLFVYTDCQLGSVAGKNLGPSKVFPGYAHSPVHACGLLDPQVYMLDLFKAHFWHFKQPTFHFSFLAVFCWTQVILLPQQWLLLFSSDALGIGLPLLSKLHPAK